MARLRRILRNKKHMKRKVKPTKEQPSTPALTEDDLKNIPPHLLDKIPAGAALKPSAATLHRLMMQQYAPMYNPMPYYNPQQQQATNLKHENDVREQSVNQTKQDLIVQQERKRNIAQQEAANKREAKRMEHDMKLENQQLDQAEKLEERRRNLEIEQQKLNFRKELLEKDNEIRKLSMKVEEIQAINKQIEHNIELAKRQSDYEEKKHKMDELERRHEELVIENEAQQAAIKQLDSSPIKRKHKNYIIENAKLKAENAILEKINKNKEDAYIKSLENKAFNDLQYTTSINILSNELKMSQKELATQINQSEDIKRKISQQQYLKAKADELWKKQQEQSLEETRLTELEKHSKTELPTEAAKQAAKKDIENQQKQTQIEDNIALQRKIVEGNVADSKLEYLMSPQSQANMQAIANLENAIEAEQQRTNEASKTAALYSDAKEKQYINESKIKLNKALLNGEELTTAAWDNVDSELSTVKQNANLKVAADEYERANQAADILRRLHEKLKAVYVSQTENGEALRQYAATKKYKLDDLNYSGLVEFVKELKQNTGVDILLPPN